MDVKTGDKGGRSGTFPPFVIRRTKVLPRISLTHYEREEDEMNCVWRFFANDDGLWQWQQIVNGETVAQSRSSYEDYDACVKDAKQRGYKFEASQQPSPRSISLRPKSSRAYR